MRIAICFPARNIVETGFAFDLANMIGHSCAHVPGLELGIYTSLGTLIIDQRCNLAREALKEKAEWILWIDSDMRFPKDALKRLLGHKQAIVAANYVTRSIPVEPISFNFVDGKWLRVPTLPESTGLEHVTGTGMGLMLTKAEIFNMIEMPWFHIAYSTVNHTFHGEDMFFCQKAAAKGFRTMIDHDLSKQVKHIGAFEFIHEHVQYANTAMAEIEAGSGLVDKMAAD